MTRFLRVWFCLAMAITAAAIADPLVESASNRGFFGRGTFTDHSTWDVIPALLVGLIFATVYLGLRIRAAFLSGRRGGHAWLQMTVSAVGSNIVRLIPYIFVAQIFALFLMETLEQWIVYGHVLGGTLWLGGPMFVSLGAHAFTCVVVSFAAAFALRACADATLRLIQFVGALVVLRARDAQLHIINRFAPVTARRPLRVLCRLAERAPPIPA